MEAGIQQLLSVDEGVVSLSGKRIYPLILPDSPALPAITYQRISTVREYATTGAIDLSRIRLQIDSWASTYAECRKLDAAIRRALECFNGTLPDAAQTYVETVMLVGSYDLYEAATRRYRVLSEYIISAAE